VCYYRGVGVAEDFKKAIEYYQLAANQNIPNAYYNLGVCYEKGHGVAKDETKAIEFYHIAAKYNDSDALLALGVCHECGIGVKMDEKEAIRCYRLACEQNHMSAPQCLAELLEKNGELLEAVVWYSKFDPPRANNIIARYPEYFLQVCTKWKEMEQKVESLNKTITKLKGVLGNERLKAMKRFETIKY
jgi:TPR repeat protein